MDGGRNCLLRGGRDALHNQRVQLLKLLLLVKGIRGLWW
jgi:hypothetical protein